MESGLKCGAVAVFTTWTRNGKRPKTSLMKRNGLAWLHIQVELLSGEQSFFPRAIAELKEAQVPQFVLQGPFGFPGEIERGRYSIRSMSPGFQVRLCQTSSGS